MKHTWGLEHEEITRIKQGSSTYCMRRWLRLHVAQLIMSSYPLPKSSLFPRGINRNNTPISGFMSSWIRSKLPTLLPHTWPPFSYLARLLFDLGCRWRWNRVCVVDLPGTLLFVDYFMMYQCFLYSPGMLLLLPSRTPGLVLLGILAIDSEVVVGKFWFVMVFSQTSCTW